MGLDLSKLSDKDLEALSRNDYKSMSDEGLKHLHDATLPVESDSPGIGSKLLGLIQAGSKKFDSYAGAPSRSAIAAAQNADSLNPIDWAKAGGSAFAKQFGGNPDLAPTGEALVKTAGVPEGIPSKLAGFAMDMAANPVNFAGPVISGAGKLVGAAKEIPVAGQFIKSAIEFPGKMTTKLTSSLIKTPEQAVKIYGRDPGVVNDFVSANSGELSSGADAFKQKILDSISETKKGLREQINADLSKPGASSVPAQPILDKLEAARGQLNPHYNAGDVAQIDDMISAVQNTSRDGFLTLPDLFETKGYLQTRSKGSFVKDGNLFINGGEAQKAANAARQKAAELLHAHPDAQGIKHADAIYSDLHDLDDKMSASLLGKGNSENVFASAGGATDKYANQHYTALKEIGDITKTNPLADAQTVYAAKELNKHPSLAKEVFKTLITLKQEAGSSNIPARGYNTLQMLGIPSTPVQNNSSPMQRRLANQ